MGASFRWRRDYSTGGGLRSTRCEVRATRAGGRTSAEVARSGQAVVPRATAPVRPARSHFAEVAGTVAVAMEAKRCPPAVGGAAARGGAWAGLLRARCKSRARLPG